MPGVHVEPTLIPTVIPAADVTVGGWTWHPDSRGACRWAQVTEVDVSDPLDVAINVGPASCDRLDKRPADDPVPFAWLHPGDARPERHWVDHACEPVIHAALSAEFACPFAVTSGGSNGLLVCWRDGPGRVEVARVLAGRLAVCWWRLRRELSPEARSAQLVRAGATARDHRDRAADWWSFQPIPEPRGKEREMAVLLRSIVASDPTGRGMYSTFARVGVDALAAVVS